MTIEVTAKKVEDAINQGLRQLGATLDEVDVAVIESGGLFRKAKVRLTIEREEAHTTEQNTATAVENKQSEKPAAETVKAPEQKQEKQEKQEKREKQTEKPKAKAEVRSEQPEAQKQKVGHPQKQEQKPEQKKVEQSTAESSQKPRKMSEEDKVAAAHALDFVKEVVSKMGFGNAAVTPDETGEMLAIKAEGGDDSLLIGRHGETLSALSYLAETVARAEKSHINITVDCNGYRDRRAASLTAMAKRRANECAAKRRKIKLEPMERVDRRTVHNALTGDNRVTTASEGKEPHRYVVIIPNNKVSS